MNNTNAYYTRGRRPAQLQTRKNRRGVLAGTCVPSSGDSKKLRTAVVLSRSSSLRTTMTQTNDNIEGTNRSLSGCKPILAVISGLACKANQESLYNGGVSDTPRNGIRILLQIDGVNTGVLHLVSAESKGWSSGCLKTARLRELRSCKDQVDAACKEVAA